MKLSHCQPSPQVSPYIYQNRSDSRSPIGIKATARQPGGLSPPARRSADYSARPPVLEEIARIVRQPKSKLRGRERINRRVGRKANQRKVEKHFEITVDDDNLTWARDPAKIAAEAQLDGIYVVRTSLGADAINAHEAVEAYKSLSRVERAFRNLKMVRLEVRPVYVYSADRVRAQVFLCALACYVEWHIPTTSSRSPPSQPSSRAAPSNCSTWTPGKCSQYKVSSRST